MHIYPSQYPTEHTAGDRTPYTYHICWSELNKHYYGVRYGLNVHPSDLWIDYFTSSDIVKEFRKEHGDPDIIEVRKIFVNIEKAQEWEVKVLRRLNVVNDSKWLNESIGHCFGESHPKSDATKKRMSDSAYKRYENEPGTFTGKHHTEQTLQIMRERRKEYWNNKEDEFVPWNKGKTKETDERLAKCSSEATGRILTEEHLNNLRIAVAIRSQNPAWLESLKKPKSDSHKESLSKVVTGKKHYNNGIIGIHCYPENVPEGFMLGMLKDAECPYCGLKYTKGNLKQHLKKHYVDSIAIIVKEDNPNKRKPRSAQNQKALRDAFLGKKKFNNGRKEIYCYPGEEPDGFVLGMLKNSECLFCGLKFTKGNLKRHLNKYHKDSITPMVQEDETKEKTQRYIQKV